LDRIDLGGEVQHDLRLRAERRTPGPEELRRASWRLEEASAEEVLGWALKTYADDLTLSLSFGGAEGMVLLDMLWRQGARVRVFTLDTGFLFEETVEFREKVMKRYEMPLEVVQPELSVAAQAKQFGDRLYRSNPDLCCYMRKVEPQRRALAGYGAWITGIRRNQTEQRANEPVVGWEEHLAVAKIAPLATWSAEQVRDYVDRYEVPLNPLLEKGYKSIGCQPCTRRVQDGEQSRAGRWADTEKTECGLHSRSTWLERIANLNQER
jgi:phosphoadenosine phosphosulfate reductase